MPVHHAASHPFLGSAGKSALVQLADKEVDVSEGFALYCTTRLPNPKFTPELSGGEGAYDGIRSTAESALIACLGQT